MTDIVCKDCGAPFEDSRTDARRARWEPFSTASQHALDHGPMICPDCVKRLLDGVLEAMAGRLATRTPTSPRAVPWKA